MSEWWKTLANDLSIEGRSPRSGHRMAAERVQFPWRRDGGAISTNLDGIWGTSDSIFMYPWECHVGTTPTETESVKDMPIHMPLAEKRAKGARLEHIRIIPGHLMASISPSGRRVARRDMVYRASSATHPNGLGAPPKAAHQDPVAALRLLDDAPHRPANRAYPRGLGGRSNDPE